MSLCTTVESVLTLVRCKKYTEVYRSNVNKRPIWYKTITNKGNIDVAMIAETKIDASFTTAQFLLNNYHQPFRLDINSKSGGILVYIKSSVPSRKLKCDVLLKSIQAIPFELNLRKEKWLVISIYRPPSQDSEFFLNSLTIILDHFTKTYDNYLIMGDFNLEPHDKRLGYFLNSNNLNNLVKTSTCFKGSASCIDLILTNRKYSFKNTISYEIRISDHHHMIITMLKTTFQQKEPKCFFYRDYKNFIFENFKSNLQEALQSCKGSYGALDNYLTSILNKHAPKKKKVLRRN